MFGIENQARSVLVATFAALVTSACGGGSTSTSTPPPPPPINFAPEINLSVSKAMVEENEEVILDASNTIDDNGDPLTFTWSQIAGPDIEIPDAAADRITLKMPFVNEDTDVEFKISVSDGQRTVTETVSFTITNRDLGEDYENQSKKTETTYTLPSAPQLVWNDAIGLLDENGDIIFTSTRGELTANDYRKGPFPGDARFIDATRRAFKYDEPIGPGLSFSGNVQDSIVVKPSDDEVLIVSSGGGDPVSTSTLNVDAPCAADTLTQYSQLIDTSTGFRADPLGLNGVVVAKSGGGFSVFESIGFSDFYSNASNRTTHTELSVNGNPSGVFCDILATNRYIDRVFSLVERSELYAPFDPRSTGLRTEDGNLLLGFDREAQSISLFLLERVQGTDTVDLSHLETVSLDLETSANLTFVDSVVMEAYGSAGLADAGLALLFTDGQDEGTHRLVIVGVGAGDTIVQSVRSWPTGVPVAIAQGRLYGLEPLGGCNSCPRPLPTQDLIVALENTDNLIVFSQPGFRNSINPYPSFIPEPARLDVGDARWFELERPADVIGSENGFIVGRSDDPEVSVLTFIYEDTATP